MTGTHALKSRVFPVVFPLHVKLDGQYHAIVSIVIALVMLRCIATLVVAGVFDGGSLECPAKWLLTYATITLSKWL